MREVKLIAFDLDGTLLTTEKKITEYTKDVLERAIQRGIEVVPATGRPLMGLPEKILDFPGIRYVVTSNGARVVDVKSRETLYSRLLPLEKAKEILAIFKQYDTMRDVFYNGQGYMERKKIDQVERFVSAPAMVEYIRTTRIPVDDIEELLREENKDVDKVQAIFSDVEEMKKAWERLRFVDGIEPSGALRNNIEVNAQGVHKGIALLTLGERLGICAEEMLTFGDGSNDIGMLRTAGTGVAMANGAPEVKKAADAVAGSNDENGVAEYIERYVLK